MDKSNLEGNRARVSKFMLEKKREYRRHAGRAITAAEFARHLGVPNTVYSKWETGLLNVSYEYCLRLWRFFGDEVFTVAGHVPPSRLMFSNERELLFVIEHWSELDAKQRKQIHQSFVESIKAPAKSGDVGNIDANTEQPELLPVQEPDK